MTQDRGSDRAERRVLLLEVELQLVRSERDRESAARVAAVSEVQRLREMLIRLEARLDVLEAAEAERARGASAGKRGLASLITSTAAGAQRT